MTEQLYAMSRMAWEIRVALDMMLPNKGEICVMIGGQCCTFIPNNSTPDDTVTKVYKN
jgi:hypothetical protein